LTKITRPVFRDLDRAEVDAILARNHVGRIAYTFRDRVGIEPLGYVYADGTILCRTSPGTKLDTIVRHPWVAFEVDEVAGPYDWRSVVAYGTAYLLSSDSGPRGRESYERALDDLRRVEPATLTEDDPVPFRTVIVRIHVDELTGREARPS
jgi:nitroimidazol reductase NimA-like FMN-containing flavoprotein (pyridoxamine 5'-phosphate oxidase superfamily)